MTDYELALALEREEEHNPVGITENAVFPADKNKENYAPRTLIDQTLEIIDPTPNIHTLFMQFNARFFSNKLLSAEVKWSPRMTSCAGVCTFRPRSRDCVISLSAPLLKLRPRKDLVETLLHEMIHGYLFLTNNNRDRDGHGPEFCKHMHRINKEAGTHITIYHSFHDEVKLYQQHWWRCNGPCQKQPPYFGMVRRAMNRAPGPSDFWWQKHQQNCGGEYIKVREPEKTKSKSKSQKNVDDKKKSAGGTKGDKNLDDFFAKPNEKSGSGMTTVNGTLVPTVKSKDDGRRSFEPWKIGPSRSNNYNPSKNVSSNGTSGNGAAPAGLVKLGTSTNRVHGWGTGGPGSSSASSSKSSSSSNRNTNGPQSSGKIPSPSSAGKLQFSGTVGGVGTGRSNLLDKFSSPPSQTVPQNRPSKKPGSPIAILDDSPSPKRAKIFEPWNLPGNRISKPKIPRSEILYDCPICNLALPNRVLNEHLDSCLQRNGKKKEITKSPSTAAQSAGTERQSSPIVVSPGKWKLPKVPKKQSSPIKGQTHLDSFVVTPEKTVNKHFPCPICNESFEMDLLNEHLDKCLIESQDNEKKSEKKKNSVLRIAGPLAGPSSAIETEEDVIDLTDNLAGTGKPYVCLVCNEKIRGDIALNDHLDECVHNIFNDDSFVSDDGESVTIESPIKVDAGNDKFPCPICMKLIDEKMMNQHLDNCLSGQNWD